MFAKQLTNTQETYRSYTEIKNNGIYITNFFFILKLSNKIAFFSELRSSSTVGWIVDFGEVVVKGYLKLAVANGDGVTAVQDVYQSCQNGKAKNQV